MLAIRARRLISLLASLTALVVAGCGGVTTTSGLIGVGGQNRVWAFTPAAQLLAPATTSQSPCSHSGSMVSAVGMTSGFCVAAEGLARVGEPGAAGGLAMTDATVQDVASRAGVGLEGINVRIVNDGDLAGRGLYGYTHPSGQIDLYPDAFSSEEELAPTLGHERTHAYQFSVFGPPQDTAQGAVYERAAYGAEDAFVQYMGGGL